MNIGVIGLGYGDEGKGLVVDALAMRHQDALVTRFSGGPQAAHTVYDEEYGYHVFSSFGAGTFRGLPTYLTKHVLVNPILMANELKVLIEKGLTPEILVNSKCPIITPFDIYSNQLNVENKQHGTCGHGIYKTINREKEHYHILAEDLYCKTALKIKVELLINHYRYLIDTTEFFEAVDFLINYEFFKVVETDFVPYLGDVIFEGSQGLLLDPEIGFFPHCTPSRLDLTNILEVIDNGELDMVYLVTRAYHTRHGNGPLSTEGLNHNIKDNPYETNVSNQFQGDFRKGLLDLDLVQYAKDKSNVKYANNLTLVITHMDLVQNELRLIYKQKVEAFTNEIDFIKFISKALQIDNVLISKSPYSKDLKEYILIDGKTLEECQ